MSEHCFFCGHVIGADESCESCGAVRHTRDEKRVRVPCPRCHEVRLFPFALGSVALQSCGRCKGSFVSPKEWDALLDVFAREPLPEVIIADLATHGDDTVDRSPYRRAAPATPPDEAAPDLDEAVRCPTCGEAMDRLEFAGISGIVVDVCSLHGIWLDGGELERIVSMVHKREEPLPDLRRPIERHPPRVVPEPVRRAPSVDRRPEPLTTRLGRALGPLKRLFRRLLGG